MIAEKGSGGDAPGAGGAGGPAHPGESFVVKIQVLEEQVKSLQERVTELEAPEKAIRKKRKSRKNSDRKIRRHHPNPRKRKKNKERIARFKGLIVDWNKKHSSHKRNFKKDVFYGPLIENGYHTYRWTDREIEELKLHVSKAKKEKGGFSVKGQKIKLDPTKKRFQSKFNIDKDPVKAIYKLIKENLKQHVSEDMEVEVRELVLLQSKAVELFDEEEKKKWLKKCMPTPKMKKRDQNMAFLSS